MKNILIVCSTGIGTSHLLEARVKKQFPDFSIKGIISLKQLKCYDKQHNYSDILDYELHYNGSTITRTDAGSAVTRSLLFGSIIGGTTANRVNVEYCDELQIKITINNMRHPVEYIDLLKENDVVFKLSKSSVAYKQYSSQADEILSMLRIVTQK